MPRTNMSSTRHVAGETLPSPDDPVVHYASVVDELGFCLLDRAVNRPTLNDTV